LYIRRKISSIDAKDFRKKGVNNGLGSSSNNRRINYWSMLVHAQREYERTSRKGFRDERFSWKALYSRGTVPSDDAKNLGKGDSIMDWAQLCVFLIGIFLLFLWNRIGSYDDNLRIEKLLQEIKFLANDINNEIEKRNKK